MNNIKIIIILLFSLCFVGKIIGQDIDLENINYDKINDADKKKIKVYLESAVRSKKAENLKICSQNLNTVANIYWKAKNYEEAIKYFNHSLKVNETLKNDHAIAGIANFKGMIYADAKKYQKSIENFEIALAKYKLARRRKDMINTYLNMSLSYKNMPNMTKTIECTEAAFKLAQELNDVQKIIDCAGMLASYYNKVNNNKQEAFYFNIYQAFIDTRDKELQNSLQMLKLQNALNETERKSKELELYKKQQKLLLQDKIIIEKDSTHAKLLSKYSEKEIINELYEETIRQNEVIIADERRFLQLTKTALIVAALLLVLIFYFYFRSNRLNKKLVRTYEELKEINYLLKTQKDEITKHKEEIELQRDKLEEQRDSLIMQRDKISSQNTQINDSILYARRIQKAVLESHNLSDQIVSDYFVLLMPRDIVSGDFYWVGKTVDKVIIAVVDCTGHGVPGAFMSLLGSLFLDEIVNKEHICKPSEILNRLRDKVKLSLKQTGKDNEAKDGMDIALVSIDTEKNMEFAGAYNSLIMCRNNKIEVIKGDRMPIGIHLQERSFTNHSMKLQKDDRLYLFSDGYPDQIGGEESRKFMIANFRDLILQNASKDMDKQRSIYKNTIKKWMSYKSEEFEDGHEQIDDILVMGIKI